MPYTPDNPPPPPHDRDLEWVLNPATGEFELRRRANADPSRQPQSGPAPPPAAPIDADPPSTGPYGGGSGGGDFDYGGGPQPDFRPYEDANPFAPRDATFDFEPFSYEKYSPSSWTDAENEPGFQDAQLRLRKQVEGGAAYKGMLRSGMTIGSLDSVLDTNKGQNFAQFDARRFRNYSKERDDAFEGWVGNLTASRNKFLDEYGIDRDIYDRYNANVDRKNNYNFNVDDRSLSSAIEKWKSMIASLTSLARPV